VGDVFPDLELQQLDGQPQRLASLLGERLTVVVIWSNRNRLGQEQVRRLQQEVVAPFQSAGIQVIAVNVGDSPEAIMDILPSSGDGKLVVLRDPDAKAFAEVAKERLPRTYLLDAQGQILWFDIEYSRHTRRELANAVYFYLGVQRTGET